MSTGWELFLLDVRNRWLGLHLGQLATETGRSRGAPI